MRTIPSIPAFVVAALGAGTLAGDARAQETLMYLRATDAIHLAGRTDLVIPAIGESFLLDRPAPTLDQVLETLPPSLPMLPGQVLTFAVQGEGYFGPQRDPVGPDGDVAKEILPVGGISGYRGPGGSVVGVFLDDAVPVSDPPPLGDFSVETGIGTDFSETSPALGQVFFIGDGRTGSNPNRRHLFFSPEGTTRLFVGVLDGGPPVGLPGYYTDNEGVYLVAVPEASAAFGASAAVGVLAALAARGRRSPEDAAPTRQ